MADSKREKVSGSYLEYKGKPLVREENTIVYGDMSEKYVLILEIMSYKEYNGSKVPGKIFIQVVNSQDSSDVFKEGQKDDIYQALDIGIIWLDRALRG
ncbi:MAG: hypothetical protein IKA82_03645 [Clostridia bacterium]|nr:hypothetical protein [Clostridia bacterium]